LKMTQRSTPFILVVLAGAMTVALLLPPLSTSGRQEELTAIVVLAALAVLAELLSFLLPKGVVGSIGAMPILAATLISPSWSLVAAVAVVMMVAQVVRRSEFPKAVFNIGQYSFSFGLGAFVYLQLGGVPLHSLRHESIGAISLAIGFPAFVAFAVAMTMNTMLVSTVIALSTGSKLSSVWQATNIAKIGVDILSSPLIFMFAWAYTRFGPIASAAMWVPIVGLRQMIKTNLELERTNVELLDLMVKSIEARDPYTSGHSRRVQEYSMIIARSLSLPEKLVQTIGRAALLHDIGKIHEKYGPILRKADRLSPEEWNTMREHPADGAELIATMTPLRELVGAVRHHHENWDGTGYPDGLAGELIPLAARIIRFADTIDAMTTLRPYRPVMKLNEVRAEIVRCRGSQFDPQLVDRLLSSPAWRTMFAPEAEQQQRYGELTVLAHKDKAPRRSIGV
jgi:putative nucleotidyltransferase with HDIG domain